jgi:NADH dehydrogenase
MNRIVIIGGGFAGLMAATTLRRHGQTDISLIDRKTTSDFLPLLPDVAAGRLDSALIAAPLPELAGRHGFRFVHDTVNRVDRDRHIVHLGNSELTYDYLLVAGGMGTNFYGNRQAQEHAFPLYSAQDARRLQAAVRSGIYENYVVAGGGYTGVEIATQLRVALDALNRPSRVMIVEKSPSIAKALPPWMRVMVHTNLARLNIECLESCELSAIGPRELSFSTGLTVGDALLVWVAGVRAAGFTDTLGLEHNPQGRLVVTDTLQVDERIFVAGDAALFRHKGEPLRMSIQFALTQGACAATNIARAAAGKALIPYRPLDPGYILPMANGLSCGLIFGIPLQGRLPTLLHYVMCAYRSIGWPRKRGVLSGMGMRLFG